MKEETDLDTAVTRLLLDEPESAPGSTYERRRTYLCEPLSGEAKPGYEPEIEAQRNYGIVEVGWFDLRNDANWDPLAANDSITYSRLQSVRRKLGYLLE